MIENLEITDGTNFEDGIYDGNGERIAVDFSEAESGANSPAPFMVKRFDYPEYIPPQITCEEYFEQKTDIVLNPAPANIMTKSFKV